MLKNSTTSRRRATELWAIRPSGGSQIRPRRASSTPNAKRDGSVRMSDFFQEVDEEVRREKAELFWKKYQNIIIVLAVAVVAATAGWRFYQFHQQRQAEDAGGAYETAITLIRDGKDADAEKSLAELAAKAPAGYRAVARLRAADLTARRDPKAGLKAFDEIAADASVDASLRDAARLRAAFVASDVGDAADFARRAEPLAADGQPFRSSVRELIGAKALQAGDLDRAAKYLDMIVTDDAAPASTRQRADLLLGLVRSGKPSQG